MIQKVNCAEEKRCPATTIISAQDRDEEWRQPDSVTGSHEADKAQEPLVTLISQNEFSSLPDLAT